MPTPIEGLRCALITGKRKNDPAGRLPSCGSTAFPIKAKDAPANVSPEKFAFGKTCARLTPVPYRETHCSAGLEGR
jgi:hypothetical protein